MTERDPASLKRGGSLISMERNKRRRRRVVVVKRGGKVNKMVGRGEARGRHYGISTLRQYPYAPLRHFRLN